MWKCTDFCLIPNRFDMDITFGLEYNMEGLRNITEEDVEELLNGILPTMPNVCSCKTCRLDMATYALNRLKPNYVRSDKGALFHKVNTSSPQAKTEILATVVNAINIISEHPNHEQGE